MNVHNKNQEIGHSWIQGETELPAGVGSNTMVGMKICLGDRAEEWTILGLRAKDRYEIGTRLNGRKWTE